MDAVLFVTVVAAVAAVLGPRVKAPGRYARRHPVSAARLYYYGAR